MVSRTQKMDRKKGLLFPWFVFVLEIFYIVVFAVWGKYGKELDETATEVNGTRNEEVDSLTRNYPMFQDINLMVFAGIGCLYAFLWRYGYTGLTANFLLCAITTQWGIIVHESFHLKHGKMELDVTSLVRGEYAAASAVIALGAIFGKAGFVQMIVFSLLEVLAYSVVNNCCKPFLQISDAGESVSLHFFAAIFGCTTAFVVDRGRTVTGNSNEKHSYPSDQLCFLGTLIIWTFWPSFNAYGDKGESQHRNMLNTYLALIGSGVTSFATSALVSGDNKITMGHVQNGALAGAVGIGAICNLRIEPFAALLVGGLSGAVCVFGLKYLTPLLVRSKVHDSCGIISLHGLPGLLSGILGILAAFLADTDSYGYSLYKFYPARAPRPNTTELLSIEERIGRSMDPGIRRTKQAQAVHQFIYIIAAFVSATIGGLATGAALRMKILDNIEEKEMYLDDIMFDMSHMEK